MDPLNKRSGGSVFFLLRLPRRAGMPAVFCGRTPLAARTRAAMNFAAGMDAR